MSKQQPLLAKDNCMEPEDAKTRNLKPGAVYSVKMEDCCIQGQLHVGQFVRWDYEYGEAIFEMGRVGPFWGAWEAIEQT